MCAHLMQNCKNLCHIEHKLLFRGQTLVVREINGEILFPNMHRATIKMQFNSFLMHLANLC